MDHEARGKRPYARILVIHEMTESPVYGTYIRGRLGLAGVDLSTPLDVWLDAVYAAFADAPHEHLEKLMSAVVKAEVKLRPEDARATWGLLPEHQVLSGGLAGKGSGHAPPSGPLPDLPTGRTRRRA